MFVTSITGLKGKLWRIRSNFSNYISNSNVEFGRIRMSNSTFMIKFDHNFSQIRQFKALIGRIASVSVPSVVIVFMFFRLLVEKCCVFWLKRTFLTKFDYLQPNSTIRAYWTKFDSWTWSNSNFETKFDLNLNFEFNIFGRIPNYFESNSKFVRAKSLIHTVSITVVLFCLFVKVKHYFKDCLW